MIQNDTFIRALLKKPVPYTPIWLMRQAGRYLPEYRVIRNQVEDFVALCKNPKLAAEVTLQPISRYPLDAAILFSDILTIPEAMDVGLAFVPGEGPMIRNPTRTLASIENLIIPEPNIHLNYVLETIDRVKTKLQNKIPLIGFCGSPWTVACYMVEGGSTKEFRHIKGLLYREPQTLHRLLHCLSEAITRHLNAQIAAGCDAVMLFDTWGGVLTTRAYQDFSLAYMKKIVSQLTQKRGEQIIPNIVFTKQGGGWLEDIAECGADAVGLDWTIDIGEARARIGNRVALQGNLDPCVLYGTPKRIREEVATILASYGEGSGHIFNLGHGIHQYVDPLHVDILVQAVHEQSRAYHGKTVITEK